jgi:hypothetical protein
MSAMTPITRSQAQGLTGTIMESHFFPKLPG